MKVVELLSVFTRQKSKKKTQQLVFEKNMCLYVWH